MMTLCPFRRLYTAARPPHLTGRRRAPGGRSTSAVTSIRRPWLARLSSSRAASRLTLAVKGPNGGALHRPQDYNPKIAANVAFWTHDRTSHLYWAHDSIGPEGFVLLNTRDAASLRS